MPATYRDERCPKCGADVYDNTENKRNPKAPDYKCSDKDCDYVVWPSRGRGNQRNNDGARSRFTSGESRAEAGSTRSGSATTPRGNDDRSNRIERQHSQEMALRLAAIDNTAVITDGKFDMKKLKWFIDWFQRDVGHAPLNAPVRQAVPPQREPEPEPERERGPNPPDIGGEQYPEDDEIPF